MLFRCDYIVNVFVQCLHGVSWPLFHFFFCSQFGYCFLYDNYMLDVLMMFLVLQAAQVNFVVGSHVWIEDPEVAWIDGEILEVNGEEIKVDCTSGKTVSVCFDRIRLSSCIRDRLWLRGICFYKVGSFYIP